LKKQGEGSGFAIWEDRIRTSSVADHPHSPKQHEFDLGGGVKGGGLSSRRGKSYRCVIKGAAAPVGSSSLGTAAVENSRKARKKTPGIFKKKGARGDKEKEDSSLNASWYHKTHLYRKGTEQVEGQARVETSKELEDCKEVRVVRMVPAIRWKSTWKLGH